jgi:LuxR family maltose regulon positive regulatory protein
MHYGTQANIGLTASPDEVSEEAIESSATYSGNDGGVEKPGNGVPIRISTLGQFTVSFDGQPLCSSGKAQQRPLALLKALIALGGQNVACSQLWECLWPDSEGDLGVRNLTITVHRLRHMLRTHAAVLQHGGKLTLNEQVCSVDAWNFERLVNDGLRRLDEPKAGDASEFQLRSAFGLYAGDFFALESEESWMFAPRLRLKTKFERLVAALATHLERQNRFSDAIDVCLQALELDPLNELLYRRLMGCYLKRGELAEAARTYGRCREALAKGLAMHPSMETERLYLEGVRGAGERGVARNPTQLCEAVRL